MGWGVGGGHVNVPATSYVISCFVAEISGVVGTLYVATLQTSLMLLRRYMLLQRCMVGEIDAYVFGLFI
jgi:hypothetical protein